MNAIARVNLALILLAGSSVPGLALESQVAGGVSPVVYDTVVVRGTSSETNPLFVYEALGFHTQLVDSTTVVFADGPSNRLIYADLVTGSGWEAGGPGGGPDEFNGRGFMFTESGGYIHAAISDRRGVTFDSEGKVVGSGRYPVSFFGRGVTPIGILGSGVLLVRTTEQPDPDRTGPQSLAQAIRAYSRDGGLEWAAPLPSIGYGPPPRDPDRISGGASVDVEARHSTIVWTNGNANNATVLNADGSERGRIALEYEPYSAHVAADETIWVLVWEDKAQRTGFYRVFDRNLSFVRDVRESAILDSWGDYLLTLSDEETGLQLLHLLKLRR